jgi:hypothetical protein
MTNYNNYYNEITNELVAEHGKGILSSSSNTPRLPIVIAQRINDKYPSVSRYKANPMGQVIAKRYMSLVLGVI